MRDSRQAGSDGFTLPELVIGLTVLAIVSISLTALFTSLINSAVVAKQKAVSATLATNQMEYLKSLPYDNLAVQGGSIYATSPIPASTTKKVNGFSYTVKTSISYVDDAYDGCGSYPNQTLKQTYCRNYPPPSGAPSTDTNPADYKIADVTVYNAGNQLLAEVDTEISAKVAETASTTGALFVNVIDSNGNPVSGATVQVTNNVVGPVSVSDATDENGIAIFYGLPVDSSNYDYVVTASNTGYSTITTIKPSGTLQPNYPNQKILSQQSSYVTLPIKLQGPNSLLVESTDTSGSALAGVKVYIKGGYKKYTATTNTAYCYDDMIQDGTTAACSTSTTSSDNRLLTDSNGLAAVGNLVPGQYFFCGDAGATSCQVGSTTYYLVAAVPYSGTNSLQPVSVPIYDPTAPPSPTYAYSGNDYYQKVRLMFSTSSTFPRVWSISPYDVSLTGGTISNFAFTVTGANLPCSATASSCGTTVKLSQGSSTYTASCTGTSGTLINCAVNLTGASQGNLSVSVTAYGSTLNLPTTPLGGISVTP